MLAGSGSEVEVGVGVGFWVEYTVIVSMGSLPSVELRENDQCLIGTEKAGTSSHEGGSVRAVA